MSPTTVLIVEDEAVIALQLEACLKRLGYAVIDTVATSAAALEYAATRALDLVLMDIRLRGEPDGIATAQQLHSRFDLPVIYLTAYADADTLRRAQVTEPFGYLLKPFREHELHATIEMALYRHRMERELRRSQTQYERVVQHIKEALVVTDRHGAIVYANQAFLSLFGWQAPDLATRTIEHCLTPEGWRIWQEQQELLQAGREQSDVLCMGRRHDATSMYLELTLVPISDEHGFAGIQTIIRDITTRKRTEDALHEQARRLETLHTIGRVILAGVSLAEIAENTLRQLAQIIPYQYASVVLLDHGADTATLLAEVAPVQYASPLTTHIATNVSSMMETLRHGQVYLVDNARAIAQGDTGIQPFLARGIHSLVTLPLTAQETLIGMLILGNDRPGMFNSLHIDVLRHVADMLGIAIYNARLFVQVHEGRSRLQALSRQLIEIQETERRTLARELHDELGQALTAIKINLQAMQALQTAHSLATLDQVITDSIEVVDLALRQTRDLSADLRPALLDDLGLVAALRWYLDRQQQRTHITIRFSASLHEAPLSSDLNIVCFRIVQEAVTNVVRHAQAQNLHVTLRQDATQIQLTIIDDGIGFDIDTAFADALAGASAGLLGMQERTMLLGGRFTIESSIGAGTTIHTYFPCTPGTRLERRQR